MRRARELRAILSELPGYRNGPYADIRKWVLAELDATRVRGRVVHRDSIAVAREGAAQIALVGMPNAGKSSLLQALSNVQIKTGDYAFTTTRPVPALTRVCGVLVQLVEIPGLLVGAASDDRGGGRALLSVLRAADAMLLCHSAREPVRSLESLRNELAGAGIELPTLLAITKVDEMLDDAVAELVSASDLETVPVSVLDDRTLETLEVALFRLTGLVRISLRHNGEDDEHPLALRPPVCVLDVARVIHKELGESCRGARVWGPSARFDAQRVGREHRLADGDIVEILVRRRI